MLVSSTRVVVVAAVMGCRRGRLRFFDAPKSPSVLVSSVWLPRCAVSDTEPSKVWGLRDLTWSGRLEGRGERSDLPTRALDRTVTVEMECGVCCGPEGAVAMGN